jgi:hypothetical protein
MYAYLPVPMKQITNDQNKDKDKDTLAFEVQIPQNAKRSFNAKHSEHYWIFEIIVEMVQTYENVSE